MNDPVVERSPASAATIVLVALGLMLLAGVAAFLISNRRGALDGPGEMRAAFGAEAPGLGLALARATELGGGQRLVVFELPGTAPDAPAPTPEPPKEGAPPARFDWSKVSIPAADRPPRSAAFLFATAENGRDVIDALVREVEGRSRGDLGPEGGTVIVARGSLGYRGFDADWVHLRAYENGGTFTDAMRISLSTPERPCVLTATWPRGAAGSEALLRQLIAPLMPAKG